jgi:hypothetical protein
MFARVPPFLRRGVPVAARNTAGQLVFFEITDPVSSASATRFMFPGGGRGVDAADNQRRFIRVPRTGRISSLYVRARVAGTGSFTTVYTVEVNSVDTTLVATVNQNANPHEGNDTAHTVIVAAGDRLSIEMTWPGGAPTGDPVDISAAFVYEVTG